MCTDGLVQLLMMLAKPRTKLLRTNRNAYLQNKAHVNYVNAAKSFRTFIKSNLLY